MVKNILISAFYLFSVAAFGQTWYNKNNIELLSAYHPYKDSATEKDYSGCWGWYQEVTKKEYAILGGNTGTFFVDVTDPSSPVNKAYVPGTSGRREIKTFRNYCYIVNTFGGFQIVDLKYLPDSVHVIHSGKNIINQAHTLWIDTSVQRLYLSSAILPNNPNNGFVVFDLTNPETPLFLRSVKSDYSFVNAHDLFARRDTIYVNDPNAGIVVLKYDESSNRFIMLGSYSDYDKQGYNHSGFLTENGKHLIFCDEIPAGVPIHLIDVQNIQNIQPASSFLPHPLTTAHNPFVVGNEWAIVSCYEDGIYIYDISDPANVRETGFFDTYPQGGANKGAYSGFFGNWGAYPFFPSKNLICSDMQNGLFVLNVSKAYHTTPSNAGSGAVQKEECPEIFTIPASEFVQLNIYEKDYSSVRIHTPGGSLLYSANFNGNVKEKINTQEYPSGLYTIEVMGRECPATKKIIVSH